MDNNITLIVVLAGLVLFSAYFSATETAFSSLNPIKLKSMAAKGNKRAERTLAFSEKFDKILSTILIGNNIVNIAAASIGTVLFTKFFGNAGVSISTIVMTVTVLIFGEITPKVIAKDMPEQFAMLSTSFLKIFYTLFYPLNLIFSLWKKFITKLFHSKREPSMTEEELLIIVDEAQQEGGIDEEAGDLIKSAIEFEDLDAIEICTPRVAIVAVSEDMEVPEIAETFKTCGYSRLPVYQESIDNITGVIHQKDFYTHVIEEKQPLCSIISSITVIRPNIKISKLMRILQQKRSHIALLVDEYGGTLGIVTLEDILEELVGEIWDESDHVKMEAVKLTDSLYRISGDMNVFDLFEYLDMEDCSYDGSSQSVSGWALDNFEHIPAAGESFDFENLHITVENVSEQRITSLLIQVNPIVPEEEE